MAKSCLALNSDTETLKSLQFINCVVYNPVLLPDKHITRKGIFVYVSVTVNGIRTCYNPYALIW